MRGAKGVIIALLGMAAGIGCHAKPVSFPQNDITTQTEQPNDTITSKITRDGKKVIGYRIQVFAGGNKREDKNNAYRIGQELKDCFPEYPVYVHFYSPRWKCLMGNFTSYEEAQAVLETVKALGFSQAAIVKSKITVAN